MIKGLKQSQMQKLLDFCKLLDKMEIGSMLDYDVFNVDDFFTQLNWSIKTLKTGLSPIKDSDIYKGYAEKTKAEYEINNLPDNYYKLKIGTCTCKIVLSSRCYDYKLKQFYNNTHKKMYSVKCIGWSPRMTKEFKNVIYDSSNFCFGCFETLDECKQLWYMFIQEMLELNGYSTSKNMELFNNITTSIKY